MHTTKLIPVLLALPLAITSMACPTRPGDADAAGGHGGSSEMDAGSGGAKVTGGTGGSSAGGSGTGGAAGLGASGAGGGTGGVAGTIGTGGVAGTTGTGGVAGTTGTGGSGETCNPTCNTTTETCVGTKCLLNDGQMCSVASQCVSNTCTPFYLDQDGDGYGSGAAVGFCGTGAPVGYAAQNGDCCDDPAHLAVAKLIHPGAGYQTTSAGGVCNVTWDYNCSGTVEKNEQTGVCAPTATYPTCDNDYTDFPDSDCGMTVTVSACEAFSGSSGDGCSTRGGPQTVGCR